MEEAQERIDLIKNELSVLFNQRQFEITDAVYALLEFAKEMAVNDSQEHGLSFFEEAAQEVVLEG